MLPITLEGRLLPIVPCRNKAPICPGGFNAATTDPVAIAVLWQDYSGPQVGVPTGSVSGIDVLDVDPRNGGDRWFHEHRADIPQTRTHETPSGGLHLIFWHSLGLRGSTSRIARGIDVKADGGGVVWHPSSGGRVLCEGPILDLPQWIFDLATRNSSSAVYSLAATDGEWTGSSPTPSSPPGATVAGLPVSSRRDGPLVDIGPERRLPKPLYIKVCRLVPVGGIVTGHDQRRARGALSMLIDKCEGRNNSLNWAAHEIFRPLVAAGVLTYGAAESLLFDAARLNGYVAKDGAAAALATIRSGLRRADPSTSGPSLA